MLGAGVAQVSGGVARFHGLFRVALGAGGGARGQPWSRTGCVSMRGNGCH